MSYCLNSQCPQPKNASDSDKFCLSCGSSLLLRKRYRALQQIGQGGFGKTFLAWDEDKPFKPYCVIKQFLPSAKGDKRVNKAAELFKAEALRLDELGQNDQIPELLAHFESDDQLYLVQEYINGQNLAEELERKGSFDEIEVRQLLTSLLSVVQFIHEHRVIHRDIKPENIIRRRWDRNLVLVDFGAAKFVKGEELQSGTAIGTPGYAAPEQLSGKTYFKSDIYSLGVTSIHLLTAMEPSDLFDNGEDKWKWKDYLTTTITKGLTEILDRMINKAVNQRYDSAGAILRKLETLPKPKPSRRITRFPVKGDPDRTLPLETPSSSQANTLIETVNRNSSPVQEDNNVRSSQHVKRKSSQIENLSASAQHKKTNQAIGEQSRPSSANPPRRKKSESESESSSLPLPKPLIIGNKWGYVNSNGKIISELLFDEADKFSEGLAKVKINNQCGYIQPNGKLLIKPQFEDGDRFSEGMAKVKIDGKWGYIDNRGRLAILPQFKERVGDFSAGVAKVKIGNKYTYIDKTGRSIGQMFDEVDRFVEGLALVRIDQKYGYINHKGQLAIPLKFDRAKDFYGGFAQVGFEDKYGYIDRSGELVSEAFDYIDQFYEGLALVILNNKYGYINKTGRVVITPRFDYGWDFSEGLARVALGSKYGYIDKTGRVVIEPRFNYAGEFSEGLAAVSIDDKWGYINPKGEIVIEPQFQHAESFYKGQAEVGLQKKLLGVLKVQKKHYIDKQGNFISELTINN